MTALYIFIFKLSTINKLNLKIVLKLNILLRNRMPLKMWQACENCIIMHYY